MSNAVHACNAEHTRASSFHMHVCDAHLLINSCEISLTFVLYPHYDPSCSDRYRNTNQVHAVKFITGFTIEIQR